MSSRWDSERGSGGGSLAWIIVMPAALLLIFGGIQFAYYSYGKNLAVAAAQAGVRAATAYPADAERGRVAAQSFLDNQAKGSVDGGQIAIVITPTQVTVTISGKGSSIIPGFDVTVTGLASGPVERLG